MPGISYHLTMLVLKLKGVKRTFSESPIDVKKLRKEDVHVPSPGLLKGNLTSVFKVQQTRITAISPAQPQAADFLILYCPGGAFVYGPTELNWHMISHVVKKTRTKAWLVDYPKAPETKIEEITANINGVYAEALKHYNPANIILMGDSVGGNLMISLLQRLIKAGEALPARLIAISPVMDASLSNPEIDRIDQLDPLLSKPGALSAKKMCAGNLPLTDPLISPLYGSFKDFPPTHLFIAGHDIMMPDQELAVRKMEEEKVQIEVIKGESMPHIWPLLPVMKEAKSALAKIEEIIRQAAIIK